MDQCPPYEVRPYSIDALKDLLVIPPYADRQVISDKDICGYFQSYFTHPNINAKTIISENHYIDHDYLDDYAAYYVRCLADYPKKCRRLHFFNVDFEPAKFDSLLSGEQSAITADILNEHYLGFIVVKPLPETVVGRTCLKLYPHGQGTARRYPCRRTYYASLFGIPLSVETVAFQEQDSVVAACATSALWSAFQCTGRAYRHPIPSPVQITQAAVKGLPQRGRTLPNKHGLSLEEMANAIRTAGLEPVCIAVSNEEVFKSSVYAYLQASIPIVVLVHLYDPSNKQRVALHALTITGFSLNHNDPKPCYPNDFMMEASRMDQVFAHDDRIGPFAQMALNDDALQQKIQIMLPGEQKPKEHMSLSTSWKGGNPSACKLRAIPSEIIVPLYHKIRIEYAIIHDGIRALDPVLRYNCPIGPVTWDMFLTTVSVFKSELSKHPDVPSATRRNILTQEMPRYIWRVIAKQDKSMLLDLLFDATGLEQEPLMLCAIEYNAELGEHIRNLAKLIPLHEKPFVARLLGWFRSKET